MLTSDWHNALFPLNVDDSDDEAVSPRDALLVVNELQDRVYSESVTGRLAEVPNGGAIDRYFDVNDDGFVSPLDALLVINNLGVVGQPDLEFDSELFGERLDDILRTRIPASPLGISVTEALSLDADSGEFLVNTHTDRAQRDIDMDGSASGAYVAVWVSKRQDDSGWGVYGQRFSADGTRQGAEFLVNSEVHRSQRAPSVSMSADGSFVVVWQSKAQDGSGWGIYGQRFAADGTRTGSEFLVNQTTRGTQSSPVVATTTDGGFVVTWNGRGVGDVSGVFARRFDSTGVGGDEFRVNQTTKGHQLRPSIASLPNGGVVIAWDRSGAGDKTGVFVRRFDANNAALEGELLVNSTVSGIARFASVSAIGDGTYVVAWQQRPEAGGRWGVRAQRFAANGVVQGTEIAVNQTTHSIQKRPDVVHLSDNSFVVGWYGFGMDDRRGVYVRRFDSTGAAMEDEGLVNETIAGVQRHPTLAAITGGVVIGWEGKGAGDPHIGVFARSLRQLDNEVGPTITPIADRTTTVGTPVTLDVVATDADTPAGSLTYTASATNGATATFDSVVRNRLTVTPATGFTGDVTVTVSVSDGEFSVSDVFVISVAAPTQGPTITPIADATIDEDATLTIDVAATDPDTSAANLTYNATATNGATAAFDTTVPNRLTVTPATGFVGTFDVTVTVSDGANNATDTFTVTVNAPTQGPTITAIADATIDQNASLTVDVMATDPDTPAANLTYSATATNGGTVTFDSTVRNRMTVTPATNFVGTLDVTVTVSDGTNNATDTFTVTVNAPAQGPTIEAIADASIDQNASLTIDVAATDPDTPAANLTYNATATNGATATFDTTVPNRLTVVPATDFVGTFDVSVTVSDGTNSATDTFAVTVTAPTQPPTITPLADATIDQNMAYAVDVAATDPDTAASALTYSATADNGATATFDSTVPNRLIVTPAADFVGTINVTVTVGDDQGHTASDTLVLTVIEPSTAPMIGTIEEVTTTVNTQVTVDIPATDPDTATEALVFTAVTPNGGSVTVDSATNNRLTITPPADFVGQFPVTVTVTDGVDSDTKTFLVNVDAAQAADRNVDLRMAVIESDSTAGIVVGEQFEIEVRFVDVLADPERAVFSAYADILFDPELLRVDEITYGENYPAGQSGTIDNENGLVNEAGATDGLQAPPDTLVFVLHVTALAAGTTVVRSEAADLGFSETVIFGVSVDQRDNMFYGAVVVEIDAEGDN